MNTDVVIIGGGVSGLATAYDLKCRGHSVQVLERQRQAGGNAISEKFDGFLMEHGPSTMNAHIPASGAISSELGLDALRCDLGDGIRNRYLVQDGRLTGIPVGPLGFLTSKYLSPIARLRMVAEMLSPHQGEEEDETVMEFCSRRFGHEFAERVIDPLVAGIYAGRAQELSMSAVFPKLLMLEKKYGSVTLGAMHRHREGGKMPGSRLFSWNGGIATLPQTLTKRLGNSINLGCAVRNISRRADGFHINAGKAGDLQARSVIIATQPHVAAQLIERIDPVGAAAAEQIQAPPVAVVYLGYQRHQVSHPLDGLGLLTSEAENRNILGAQFCSTMFPGRAPEGHVAVSAYVGGARSPDLAGLSTDELIDMVRSEFSDLIGAKGNPVMAKVRHWPLVLPQYRLGHEKLVRKIEAAHERQAGLFMTGNYLAGPSVAACLTVAKQTASRVDDYLAIEKGQRTERSAIK